MTRDILDTQGNVIGQLTLPDDTSEDAWAYALSHYAFAPATLTTDEIIRAKVVAAQEFGAKIVEDAKVGNVALGITQAGKTKEASDYLSDLARYLNEGSLYPAVDVLESMIAGTIPEDLQPFITMERLTETRDRIKAYLGIV